MSFRIAAAILLALMMGLLGWHWRHRTDASMEATRRDRSTAHESSFLPADSPAPGAGASTKHRERPPRPRLTLEQTKALVEQPLNGAVHFPEQLIVERVEAINRFFQQCGISPQDLQVVVGEGANLHRRLPNARLEEIELNHPTPAQVLKYTTGTTVFYYRIKAGLLEIRDAGDPNPDLVPTPDPAAEDRAPFSPIPLEEDPFGPLLPDKEPFPTQPSD